MSDGYLIDDEAAEARRRLHLLEALDDPGTIACFEEVGVGRGWSCLEIGAGGGSMAAWLCRRVGREGRVVAVDLNARFLRELDFENLEIREEDVGSGTVENETFDLVHARSVLMHVADREVMLERLVRALEPGGWLIVEEPDSASDGPDPASPPRARALYERALGAVYDFARERGIDPDFGRGLDERLRKLGLEAVESTSRVHTFRGGREPRSAHMPALREIKHLVVERGPVTAAEYQAFLELEDDPQFSWRESTLVSVRGRKPGA